MTCRNCGATQSQCEKQIRKTGKACCQKCEDME